MTHTITKQPKSRIEVSISLPWEEWKKFVEQAVEEISKEIKIEGFRPGKAPRHLVEQKAGSAAILENSVEKAVRKSYADFLVREKIEAIGKPEIEVLKMAEGNPLEYKVRLDVIPEVLLEPWQDAIKKKNAAFNSEKEDMAEEAEIKKELDHLAASRVQLEKVEREARLGDSVKIDFTVSVGGVPIENGTSRNHPLVLGKGVFIPGFEEQVSGLKAGEEKEFELKFPEDYHAKNLAGKPAQFKVKVNAVEERKTPAINDAFAKSLGKFETLEALRQSIRDGILEEKKKTRKERHRVDILDVLIEKSKIDLPESLIHEELHRMIHEFEAQLGSMGMNFEKYLEQMKKSQEDIEKEWRPQAEKRIKSALVLEQVAKDRTVEVSAEDIENEMNKVFQYYKNVKNLEKNIDLERLYAQIKSTMTNEKVFEMLELL